MQKLHIVSCLHRPGGQVDVTSTTFGLLIAFVLPGLAALLAASFWSTKLGKVFDTFMTTESNTALFFLAALTSVAVSLVITVIRWALFERWICRKNCLGADDFAKLGSDTAKLTAFRATVDEHYRYHQFWGAMLFVIPAIAIGMVKEGWSSWTKLVTIVAIALVSEVCCFAASVASLNHYYTRSRKILTGG